MKIIKFILLINMFFILGCSQYSHQVNNVPFNVNKFSLQVDYDYVEAKNSTGASATSNEKIKSKIFRTKNLENIPKFIKPGHMPRKMGNKIDEILNLPIKKLKVSVENIPLNKFIHLVLGDILNLNYTVDGTVENRKDKVTLRMDKKIPSKEFYNLIEGILEKYNINLINDNGILFVTGSQKNNKQKLDYKISIGKNIQYNNIPNNEIIYQIIPVEYISLSSARDTVSKFALSKDKGRVYEMKDIHGLLIKDYVSNIKKAISILTLLDHPYMKNKMFKLIYLEHIDVQKFYNRIEKILDMMGIKVGSSIKDEPLSMMTIDEINAILVVTDKSELINTIMYWKRKLDNIDELDDKKQLFVYKTKNREAKEVEKILTKLLSGIKTTNLLEKKQNKDIKINKKNSMVMPVDTKITVDEERNMLIFYMLPSEYKTIYELLKKIDTRAKQILIEVTIAEVTLVDKLQYGIEWYFKDKSGNKNFSIQTLDQLGLGSGGISGIISGKHITAMLNAFAQNNVLKILSSPKIVVLNNKTASFNVGTQVPVITSQSTATDLGSDAGGKPTFVQNVTYRNTGISTNIKPTITADNAVMLSINQTVSEAQNNNVSNISSPIIVNRSISTSVLLKHGEALMIGGLIKENKSNTDTKVPILGDLPVVGEAFKTSSNTTDRTELIFIVKPYIIEKVQDATVIYKAFKNITAFSN